MRRSKGSCLGHGDSIKEVCSSLGGIRHAKVMEECTACTPYPTPVSIIAPRQETRGTDHGRRMWRRTQSPFTGILAVSDRVIDATRPWPCLAELKQLMVKKWLPASSIIGRPPGQAKLCAMISKRAGAAMAALAPARCMRLLLASGRHLAIG